MTPKQERFVQQYLIDLNATQAAIRAGYSKKTAGSQGHDLLKNPEIAAAIKKAQKKAISRYERTHDEVLESIYEIGQEARVAMQYSPALRAKELIGKHFGMWPDKREVTGPNGGPIQAMTATVVVDAKDLTQAQRDALRAALLAAKAKETNR